MALPNHPSICPGIPAYFSQPRSGYNQLRQLRPVVRSLSVNATKTLVQVFVSCRLDCCNSLLYGISDRQLLRLQLVQNAAARLVTGSRRSDHITPVLRQLHWLPVRQRVAFKVAGFVHQSLAGAAPMYLADNCHHLYDAFRCPLRSHSNDAHFTREYTTCRYVGLQSRD